MKLVFDDETEDVRTTLRAQGDGWIDERKLFDAISVIQDYFSSMDNGYITISVLNPSFEANDKQQA